MYQYNPKKIKKNRIVAKYPTRIQKTEQRHNQVQEEDEEVELTGSSATILTKFKLKRKHSTPVLRQRQLQEQEDLYHDIDLLGETILHPSEYSFRYSQENVVQLINPETIAHSSRPIPFEEMPQTSQSQSSRRTSKHLSPSQIAQLEKLRMKRYEQRDSLSNNLKAKYSFLQQKTHSQSPREIVYKKSVVNAKKKKDQHTKPLPLPVMDFPPPNWPTPVIIANSQDLRNKQRQYFETLQQTQGRPQIASTSTEMSSEDVSDQNIMVDQVYALDRQEQSPRGQEHYENVTESKFFTKKSRRKFIKGVYILLFIQWLLVTGIVSIFEFHEPFNIWMYSIINELYVYALLGTVAFVSLLTSISTFFKSFPCNLLLLLLFTVLVGVIFAIVIQYWPNDAVLFALGSNCAICLGLIIFACQRCDFPIYLGLCVCWIIILLLLGLVYFLDYGDIYENVYAAFAVAGYSMYLNCVIYAIVGRKKIFQIAPHDYISGVIHLNFALCILVLIKLKPGD